MKQACCVLLLLIHGVWGVCCSHSSQAAASEVADLIDTIGAVGAEGAGHEAAMRAWQQLAQAPSRQLLHILLGINGANPLADNWIRSAVESIAQRSIADGQGLPQGKLEAFLLDTSRPPRARRTAYELLLQVQPEVRDRLIPEMLFDPSLELRRDAVRMLMDEADRCRASGQDEEAVNTFRRALSAARDIDQINELADKLAELDQQVDLVDHFGFITEWYLIGPFNNRGAKGFDVSYPPETNVDLSAQLEGMKGPVSWVRKSTDEKYGIMDLNKLLGRHKGAIAYAFIRFEADEPREIDLRLGCINANKLWLNSALLLSHEIYHSGREIDQYIAKGQLKKGTNEILIKIAQNEQTEPWAQDWQFQFRLCDELGTPFHTAVQQAARETRRERR